jgi:hypothetical protein
MANVEDLRRLLEPHTEADVTSTFQKFRESMHSEDLGQFVDYMVAQGLLAPEAAPVVAAELRAGSEEATIAEPRGATTLWGSAEPQSAAPRSPAASLRLSDVLGQGGMGIVFRGEQVDLGRSVAFKQLLDASNETLRERFVREARITAQLDHPAIVPVHFLELSPRATSIGYAMKLVEGKTLRVLLTETAELYKAGKPIDAEHSLPTRLEHFLKICDAVAFAHDRRIIHRDLKPSNFMIGKFGEVYVMDWGIARPIGAGPEAPSPSRKASGRDADLTQDGEIVGSASYMSPEQAEGRNQELDARADQYALGLILFELVSLRRAIEGASTVEVFTKASRGAKGPLEHVSKNERIPAELRAIVDKATAFSPDQRYPSVAALADDLRSYLRGEAVTARPDNALGKLLRWMNRHRRTTLVTVVVALALAASAVAWSLYRRTADQLAARELADKQTALYGDVATQAHAIDSQFQQMEEALEGLRAAAEWALAAPTPLADQAPIFLDTDFADPARRPKDFTNQTAYRWPVSPSHPVVGIAPGTDRAAMMPTIRKLSPLRHHLRAMFAGAIDDNALHTPEQLSELILQRRSPIDYVYVDLPQGVHFHFPGVDALPPGYDVRTAGFYQMSANKRGKRWGRPYVDSTTDEQGDDLVLPCTQGLWSASGEFIGVAGVEITVTKLVETSLAVPKRKTLRASLLDQDGKRVIDSFDAGKRFKASGKDEGIELEDFDIPEVVTAVRAGAEGIREVRRDGRPLLAVFVRLNVLGWYYVVEVDPQTI